MLKRNKAIFRAILIFILVDPVFGSIFFDKPIYDRADIPVIVTDERFDHAELYFEGSLFRPFPDTDKFYFRETENGLYKVFVPMGFKPPVGKYEVRFHREGGEPEYRTIYFAGRQNDLSGGPYKIWTVENGGSYSNLKTDFLNESETSFGNIKRWMDFVGFDGIFFLTGQTNTRDPSVSSGSPWIKAPYDSWRWFAGRFPGYLTGGYLGAFLCFGGQTGDLDGYEFSRTVDNEGERLFRDSFVSIDDSSRIADIVALAREMDGDEGLDWIGLDYIRAGSGGFENWEEFSELFGIAVHGTGNKEKMFFLGSHVRAGDIPYLREKWRYYRAYKSARVIKTVRKSVKKPIWVFTLGWDQGHSHGQDPIMFNDAGADLIFVMFYEATYREHDSMMESWRDYLDDVRGLPIVAGQEADVVLNDAEDGDFSGPEEMIRRYDANIDVLAENGNFAGIFLHDLIRTFNGRILPHYSEEWLFAAGHIMSKIDGGFPLKVSSRTDGNKILFSIQNISDASCRIEDVSFYPGQWPECAFKEETVPAKGTLEIELPKRYSNKRLGRNYAVLMFKAEDNAYRFGMCYYDTPSGGKR